MTTTEVRALEISFETQGRNAGRIYVGLPDLYKERAESLPGVLRDNALGRWTVPKTWNSVLSLSALVKELHWKLSPSPDLAQWAAGQQKAWAGLTKLAQTVRKVEGEHRPGWYLHQEDGAAWLNAYPETGVGRILQDEMGTGKTGTCIKALKDAKVPGPILVIAKESALDQAWANDFHKWAEADYKTVQIVGSITQRRKLIQQLKDGVYDVGIIGHSNLKTHTRFENYDGLKKCIKCGGPRLTTGRVDATGKPLPDVIYHKEITFAEGHDTPMGDNRGKFVAICGHDNCGWLSEWHGSLQAVMTEAMAHARKNTKVSEVSESACQRHPKEFNEMTFNKVIVDECFVPTALVDTPKGRRAIGDLQLGDQVWGYDEIQGRVVATTVRGSMRREAAVIGGFVTANHPIRIAGDAYRPVADLRGDDIVCWADHDRAGVPVLRQGLLSESCDEQVPWNKVLQHIMCGERVFSQGHTRGSGTDASQMVGDIQSASGETEVGHPSTRAGESISRSSSYSQGSGVSSEPELGPFDWREWSAVIEADSDSLVLAGRILGSGARHLDARVPGAKSSELLQSGSRSDVRPAGSGSGWSNSHGEGSERTGCEKRARVALGRMDGSEVLEPRDPGRSRRVRAASSGDTREVVNIETGTSNYFVHGLLVHNCHLARNAQAQFTQAVWGVTRYATPPVAPVNRWGLTGTPVNGRSEGAWSPLHWIGPENWPTKGSWIDYFCDVTTNWAGFQEIKNIKPNRLDEFHATYGAVTRRVLADQVLDLPPILRGGSLERRLHMGTVQAKQYKEMAKKLQLAVQEGLITVENAAAQAGRLSMLATGCGYPHPDNRPGLPQKMLLRAPSCKLDAIIEDWKEGTFDGGKVGMMFVSSQALLMVRQGLIDKGLLTPADIVTIAGNLAKNDIDRGIAAFQQGRKKLVMLTYAKGGASITLTEAKFVCAVERSWNPDDNQQGVKRFHRIGSEKHDHITVIDYVVAGTNEIEQLTRLDEKADSIDQITKDRERLARWFA